MIKSRFARLDKHMQEVVKGTSSALIIRVIGTLLGFAISVTIARLLGAEGAGVYFLALSVSTIASTIGRAGFDNTVVRFIASHASVGEWGAVRFVNGVAVKVVGSASLGVALALFVTAPWLADHLFGKPGLVTPLMLIAVAVVPFSLAMIQAEALRGLKCIPASQWIKTVLISLVSLVLIYPCIRIWQANGAVGAYVAATITTAIAAGWLWSRAYQDASGRMASGPAEIPLRTLFQSSWPLFGVALTGLVVQQAATIFLGVWCSAEDVGVFNVANRVASLLLFPLTAMISILAPKLAALHRQEDHDSLARLARRSSRMLVVFALPVAGLVFIGAEWILSIFGPEFGAGAIVLRILLVGVVVNAATGAVGNLLMMAGHESVVRDVTIVIAVVTLGAFVWLIPGYGVLGAAIATSFGITAQNSVMALMVRQHLGFSPVVMLPHKRTTG